MIQSFCGLTGLVNFFTCLSLSIFLYFKNRSGRINKVFALWSASVAFWSFGYFMWCFATDPSSALFWSRFLMAGAIVVPSSFLHFTLIYLKLDEQHKGLILAAYLFSAVYLLLDFTPYFIRTVQPKYWFRWWSVPGILYHPYQIFFILVVVYTHILLFQKAFTAPSAVTRKQFKIVAFGTLIAFAGGSTNFFLWYNIPIPPVFNFLVTAHVLFIAYAILNYQLWDIEVIVKRTVVFSGLFLMILATVTAIVYLLSNYVVGLGVPDKVFMVMAIVAVMFFYEPTKRLLIDLTDRFLFQKKINYRTLLREASEFLAHVSNLESQARSITTFLIKKARIANASVYIVSSGEGLLLRASEPLIKAEELKRIDPSHLIVSYFKEHHLPIERQSIKEGEILGLMTSLKAEAAIPCFGGERLVAILFLGPQKSDEPYSEENLDVFFTLGQECSIAFENSRLYDEALQKTKELQATQASLIAAEKTATMVGMAKALGHEVNNPLATVVARAGFIYKEELSELKRIIADEAKSFLPLATVEKIENKLEKINENAQRIDRSGKRIEVAVRTLTNILKDTKGEQGPQNFRVLWREALEASRFSTSGCTFQDDIEPNLILHGNNEQLIQVFTNLIKNSYEAMSGMKDRKISITADIDSENQKMAKIEIKDNGPGIDLSIQHKIWVQGFSTKSKPQSDRLGETGQGQGLYICKHLIESVHKGTIAVTSQPGHGTTFTIQLPLSGEHRDG